MTVPSPDWAGVPVLVTGAGGFIGSHLVRGLVERGARVRAMDIALHRLDDVPGIDTCVLADIADPDSRRRAVEGVDVVFHLAAAHLEVHAAEEQFRRINVDAARDLVHDCADSGVRRLVHCSTVGVYGTIRNPPADEDSECRPEIPYERTKLEGEGSVHAAARERDLEAVALRPVWVYGPGCPRTEKLFRAISKGRFFVAGRGNGLRHCIHVDDMVEAFLLAARSGEAVGQTIIVGDDRAVTIRELVDRIAALTGSRPPVRVPRWLVLAAAVGAEAVSAVAGFEPPLSRRTLRFFDANTAFRVDRARRLLGFRPRHDLASGLEATWTALRPSPSGDGTSDAARAGHGSPGATS